MAVPPPAQPYPAQQHGTYAGSAGHAPTSTAAYGGGGGGGTAQNLQHPPGYVQNAGASALLDRYQQRSSDGNSGYGYGYGGDGSGQGQGQQQQNQSSFFGGGGGGGGGSGEGSAVWDTAKKWAQATGQKLADAESEVWRRINKE